MSFMGVQADSEEIDEATANTHLRSWGVPFRPAYSETDRVVIRLSGVGSSSSAEDVPIDLLPSSKTDKRTVSHAKVQRSEGEKGRPIVRSPAGEKGSKLNTCSTIRSLRRIAYQPIEGWVLTSVEL